ncbi:MAG TPA: glycosyltransferase family 39 protein [Anaerolineae bacterium]|nr:glycosyltransferase family 39 protein [Anaerolineae bacterium]
MEYLTLGLIVLLGAILRFYQLESIPVGLSGDEGADGLGARRILSGEELPLFITEDFGEEPMHTYLVALSFALWGVRLWAIRFVSAAIGIITIPVIFWLARELLRQEERLPSPVPIISAFFLATSYWHIIYSRAGLEVVALPLFSSALIYFLWRGIRTGRRWAFIVSGLILGASLYSYRGARFLPILLTLFFGGWVILSRDFRRRHLVNLVLVALVAAIVCAPLGAYAIAHPDIFFARELHVSVFNPDWDRGSPLQAFSYAALKTLGMFNFQGDPEFDRNPGRRPVLDPVSSLCFLVGLAIVLWWWRRPHRLFIVVWFLVMALPGAFTAEALPHFHRGIGALPPLCLLCAFGAVWLTERLGTAIPWRGARATSAAVLCLILLAATVLSCRDYFSPWQQRLDQGQIIGRSLIEAAEVMNATRIPDGVWILPASSLRPRNLPYYEVSFLYDGPEPEHTLTVDEETAPAELSQISQGYQRAAVINWKEYVLEEAYNSLNSDPKGLLDFLLRKCGRRLDQQPHQSFDLVTYQLPDDPDFVIAHSFAHLGVDFGDALRLEGVALGGSSLHATSTPEEVDRNVLPSGKEGWVVLQWRALADLEADYKVAVYLLDSQGRVVGQTDKLLLSNYLETTSRWDADQLEMDYYTLSCQPATPPGMYTVQVAVYDSSTMDRLGVFDADTGAYTTSIAVGQLQVIKPLAPAEVQPQWPLPSSQVGIAPGLQLLGYDLPASAAGPGETVRVALYWRATEDLSRDYLVSLELRDEHGELRSVQQGRPVDGSYPTTEWEEGEVLRDWHDLYLPPDTPTGDYELTLLLLEGSRTIGQASLGWVEVSGRPRRFDVPEIQHALEARLGDGMLFLGYDLSSEDMKPGDTLHLTLYWQALSEMQVSYTVFTHLLDAKQHIWGQMDSIPLRGEAPTTGWIPGEIITDSYDLVMEPAAPPGSYTVEIGMYDAGTGQRLPVRDVQGTVLGDRMLVGRMRVLTGE